MYSAFHLLLTLLTSMFFRMFYNHMYSLVEKHVSEDLARKSAVR